ncbi:MAG: hypothetical protein ACXWRA_09635 [Pseudobdellovibrionaceae bacterium]
MGPKSRSQPFLFLWVVIPSFVVACNNGNSSGAGVTKNQTPVVPGNQAQGSVDGGGGNYVGSEPDQIKAIFQGDNGFNLKETVKDVFKTIEFQVTNKFIGADVESIFSRMLGPDFSGDPLEIYKDIEGSPYELKSDGSCLENDGFKDASTKIDKKASSICFSLEGLKRLPIQAVPFQLVALAVHEHAHHYGFGEADAVKAQKQVLKTMNQGILNGIYMETVGAAGSIREDAARILENMSSKFSDKLLCTHLSTIDSTASKLVDLSAKIEHEFELRMLVTALDYQFGLTKQSLTGVDELRKLTRGMLAFCGEDSLLDPIWAERVDEGDRKKLQAALERVRSLAHQLVLQATNLSKQRKN